MLLLEDDGVHRLIVSRMLARLGWVVVEVVECAAALALVSAGEPFGVVLSDVNLPDGNGLELGLRLRVTHPALPIVWMSSARPPELDASLAAGRTGYLDKPFDLATLSAVLLRTAAP